MPPKPTTATWPPSRTRTTARKSMPPHSSIKLASPTPSFEPYDDQQQPQPIINSPNLNTTTTSVHVSPPIKKKTLSSTDSTLSKCSTKSVPDETQNPIENTNTEQPIIEGDVAGTGKGTRKVIRRTVKVVKRVIKRKVPKNGSVNSVEDSGNLDTYSDVIEKKPSVCVEDKLVDPVVKDVNEEEASVVIRDELRETPQVSRVLENKLFDTVKDVIENPSVVIRDELEEMSKVSRVSENKLVHTEKDVIDNPSVVFRDELKETFQVSCVSENKLVHTDKDVIENPSVVIHDELEETSQVSRVSENKLVHSGRDVIENPSVVIRNELKEAFQVSCETGVSEPMVEDRVNDVNEFEDNVGSRGHESVADDDKSDQVDMTDIDTSLQEKERVDKPNPVEDVMIEKPNLVNDDLNIQDDCLKETSENTSEAAVLRPVVDEEDDDQCPIMNVDETHDSIMDEADRNDVNMSIPDSVEEEKYVVLVEEKKDGSLGKQPESEDIHSVECNEGGLLLSDELEALERKKKRKTEIFVGGLEKDVKEDDIRKAFQGAGTVVGVDVVMNARKTGKNKGFAFVRFSTAAEATTALTKYSNVKVCGKQSHVQPVQGNDTIYLGNIDRCWKTDDVMKLLVKAGVEKIDRVSVKADPRNTERNRGFSFLEFETNRAAQNAFYKLQNRNVFGKNTKVKVAWAEPLVEPAEEEILKVKAVYAEYLPSSWNGEKVKEYFKRFGEIESVAHAKDITSSRRNDFAFINYKTREAALACIEAIRKERLLEDVGSKVKMTVSLAKPISMRKQLKSDASSATKQMSKDTSKVSSGYVLPAAAKLHDPRNNEKYANSSYIHGRGNTTDELVHLLRQQASTNHNPPRSITGPFIPENHLPLHGDKRPFPFAGHDPLYMESRGMPRPRFGYSNPIPGPSHLPHGREMEPFPYHQQPGHDLNADSVHGRNLYPRHFPTRGRERSPPPYYGNNNIYRY